MVIKKNNLVYGWGVNDVDYNVYRYEVVNGRRKQVWICPYYRKWKGVLERCLCPKFQERSPTYKGCTVCEEWKYLSNFIKWVDSQPNKDWEGYELDKDFLIQGNKHYSSETVVFVSNKINNFITDRGKARGDCILGVCYYPNKSKKKPYQANCRNPFIKGSGYIGYYPTELEAHLAWQTKKHQYACLLADLQADERVASRLREMYASDKDWTKI